MPRSTEHRFEQRLKIARSLKRWAQSDLADATGFAVSAISHFECGRRAPSLASLARLADALGVTTDFLLGRKDT